jgi:hypothetical protein
MRRRDTYWSLFHKSEKRQIDDLKTDAIEVIYEIIPEKDREDWLVWREGFATWKPLGDFTGLLIALRKGGMLNAPSQPAPSPVRKDSATVTSVKKPTAGKAKKETTIQDRLARQGALESGIDFDLVSEMELGDRAARYPKKWQIRILTNAKPLIFTTKDVSNRGFSLKEPLPKGLPPYFNVEVVANKMVIPLICSEIASTNGAPSTRLRIEVNHNPGLLQAALLQ